MTTPQPKTELDLTLTALRLTFPTSTILKLSEPCTLPVSKSHAGSATAIGTYDFGGYEGFHSLHFFKEEFAGASIFLKACPMAPIENVAYIRLPLWQAALYFPPIHAFLEGRMANRHPFNPSDSFVKFNDDIEALEQKQQSSLNPLFATW